MYVNTALNGESYGAYNIKNEGFKDASEFL